MMSHFPGKIDYKARSKARHCALQAIYQWQLTAQDSQQIIDQFLIQDFMEQVDLAYFLKILKGVIEQCAQLDEQLKPFLDRPLSQLDFVELAILRLGAYELMYQLEVPFKVILNETIELAKTFGATDGHKYVNGILHFLGKKIRTDHE